jgi:hypothetical protein
MKTYELQARDVPVASRDSHRLEGAAMGASAEAGKLNSSENRHLIRKFDGQPSQASFYTIKSISLEL